MDGRPDAEKAPLVGLLLRGPSCGQGLQNAEGNARYDAGGMLDDDCMPNPSLPTFYTRGGQNPDLIDVSGGEKMDHVAVSSRSATTTINQSLGFRSNDQRT